MKEYLEQIINRRLELLQMLKLKKEYNKLNKAFKIINELVPDNYFTFNNQDTFDYLKNHFNFDGSVFKEYMEKLDEKTLGEFSKIALKSHDEWLIEFIKNGQEFINELKNKNGI